MSSDLVCHFCGEKDFDKIGLKDHLERFCQEYADTISPAEERERWIEMKREHDIQTIEADGIGRKFEAGARKDTEGANG